MFWNLFSMKGKVTLSIESSAYVEFVFKSFSKEDCIEVCFASVRIDVQTTLLLGN